LKDHEIYIKRCLELASRGAGFVAPNPMVGAVLVVEGKIIGEGYHKKIGDAHAEVNAINSVKDEDKLLIKDATLYVNLEPCDHFGKTPPCTQLIMDYNIKKVVIGTPDPNNLVNGKGMKKLGEAGVEVIVGVLEKECVDLNKFFFTFHQKQRPFITIKWAQSADSFIAGENYTPIHLTNSYSDHFVQKMRSEHQAIFVGGRTVLSDNPKLTNRSGSGKNPLRVSLDTQNNFPQNLALFNADAESLIFNFEKSETFGNIEFLKIIRGENVFEQMITILFNKKINSILVEGGADTINTLIKLKLWDEMKIFITENKLSNGISAPLMSGKEIRTENIYDNTLITRINV